MKTRLKSAFLLVAIGIALNVWLPSQSQAQAENSKTPQQEKKSKPEEGKKPLASKTVDKSISTKDRTHILNDITFDDLKFDMKTGDTFSRRMLSKEINGYHGTKVKIRGFIRPNTKQSGITRFVFVRDNQECCFGPKAAIFDNILVKMAKGKAAEFTVRPITVEGKFALKEYKGPDGKVWSLYRLYESEVK